MPIDFHKDRLARMQCQRQVCRDAILPMLYPFMPLQARRVLELGCGDAGVLARMVEEGATGVGVEGDAVKAEWAQTHFAEPILHDQMRVEQADIFDWAARCDETFDIIVLKDVIEHVRPKRVLLLLCCALLKPDGVLFVGFPPWSSPFGGHQFKCETMPGKAPWTHLLTQERYRRWLEWAGEKGDLIDELLELPSTGLSTRAFERLCKSSEMRILRRGLWLVNPNYRSIFHLPQVASPLPHFLHCDILTTAAWYVASHR